MNNDEEPAGTESQIIDSDVMLLATAGEEGAPWVSPAYYTPQATVSLVRTITGPGQAPAARSGADRRTRAPCA